MIRYTISDDEYREMGKWILREKRGTGAKAVLGILLRTVVQMGTVAYLILSMPETPSWMKWGLGALSLLWALLSLFQFSFFDVRAGMLLKQSKNRPDLADYWKEHHLHADSDKFRVSYGDVRQEISYADVTEIRDTEALHLILSGKNVFETVPKRAVRDGEWEKIAETALAERGRLKREALDGLKKSLREEASFQARLTLSQDEMAEKVVKMTRRSFLYPCGWSLLSAFTVLFPLVLAVYSARGGSLANTVLCVACFLLFNMRLLIIFTPAAQKMVKSKLMGPGEDGYLLAVKDRTAFLAGDDNVFSYALSGLKKCVRTDDGLFVYFAKQAMLYVPKEAAGGFLTAAGLKKSLQALASAGAAAGPQPEGSGEEAAEEAEQSAPEAPADET